MGDSAPIISLSTCLRLQDVFVLVSMVLNKKQVRKGTKRSAAACTAPHELFNRRGNVRVCVTRWQGELRPVPSCVVLLGQLLGKRGRKKETQTKRRTLPGGQQRAPA